MENNIILNTAPTVVDAPNNIVEHADAFQVLGFSGPAGAVVHFSVARDVPDMVDHGQAPSAENLKVIRRRFATITMPSAVAEALAKAILETVETQRTQPPLQFHKNL